MRLIHIAAALCIILALVADVLPGDSETINLRRSLQPPSKQHPFGTDALGRDLFKRSAYAIRTSLIVGATASFIAFIIGCFLGLISGYFGGWVDVFITSFSEILLTLPFVVLIITLVAFAKAGMITVILILGFTGWPMFAKLLRGSILSIKQNQFIEAAQAIGASTGWIIKKHIWPQVREIAQATGLLSIGQNMLAEATLSFLGLGIPPSIPTLGGILNEAQTYLFWAWWIFLFPGIILSVMILSFNMLQK